MRKRIPIFSSENFRGFTLIELLVTITVVAIIAAIAMPNLQTFVMNSRITGTSNDLLRSLQTARAEATKRQTAVVMCTSSNPTATTPTCSKTNIKGWIIFQDDDNDWDRGSASEALVEAHTFESAKTYLLADQSFRVSFAATGFAKTAGTTPSTQTPTAHMVVCDIRGNTQSAARGLEIAATGRSRITRDATQIATFLTTIGSTCPP